MPTQTTPGKFCLEEGFNRMNMTNANKRFNVFKAVAKVNQRPAVLCRVMSILIALLVLAGCGPSTAELEAVDYTPRTNSE
jgi:hypothetical protein